MMTHSLILDSLGEPYNFSPNHQNKKSEEGLENGLQMKFCHLTADSWQRSGHLQFVFASVKVSSQGPWKWQQEPEPPWSKRLSHRFCHQGPHIPPPHPTYGVNAEGPEVRDCPRFSHNPAQRYRIGQLKPRLTPFSPVNFWTSRHRLFGPQAQQDFKKQLSSDSVFLSRIFLQPNLAA